MALTTLPSAQSAAPTLPFDCAAKSAAPLTTPVLADGANPTSNYGTSTTLRTDASPDLHSYLRFDVQGLTGTVTSATLRIYANSSSSVGYTVSGVSDNTWTESTINHNNAPVLGSSLGSSGAITAATWTTVDVTSYITGNGAYNFAFSTTSSTNISFSSREGANAPQLVIETSTGPTNTPTATATAGPSPTPINTGVATPTASRTPTPTRTPTPAGSITPTVPPTTPPPPFQSATFVYDGDGKRVKSTINGTITTYFVGAHYEVSGSTVTKYYYAGAQRIAMRTGSTLSYLLGDHLGSTSLTTDAAGNKVSEMHYKAWGEVRFASGNMPTKYQYTGQYSYVSDFGLHFYNARWYDSSLGRFAQADSIIPEQSQGVQAWDRYAYTNNNSVRFTDPTGHRMSEFDREGGGKPKEFFTKKLVKQFVTPGVFHSFDGGWNDPKYSTWNLLRQGSPCTACHVTHWTGVIPTNSEIDPNLVAYYRSLDETAHTVHWAALAFVGTAVSLARETAVIGHHNQNPNYVQIAEETGANYFLPESGLTAEQIAVQNEKFIVNGVQSGCRFVQCSFPVRPGSGLESEIGWLEQSGYSSGGDMSVEIITSIFRSLLASLEISQE